eukprot:TRINITY_DN3431_c0_g1_i3.p1 TRINITY_DN3431_c0_g1~~TRINITY_DN3431_c0_g1_i3.p1  ORF type:complete len:95 (+),score=2.57 TRINITY_DN3431_c0_g1_i3:276-560(+)
MRERSKVYVDFPGQFVVFSSPVLACKIAIIMSTVLPARDATKMDSWQHMPVDVHNNKHVNFEKLRCLIQSTKATEKKFSGFDKSSVVLKTGSIH